MHSTEEIIEAIEEMSPYLAVHTEAQLADYGETANGGPYVKLRLADTNELENFRGHDRATRTKAGKRYILMMIEVADDETVVDQRKEKQAAEKPKGGPMSKRAASLCRDQDFHEYLATKWGQWLRVNAIKNPSTNGGIDWEKTSAAYIYDRCLVNSRAEIDHKHQAASAFHGIISSFNAWLMQTGRTAA